MEPISAAVGVTTLLRNGSKAVSTLVTTIKDHKVKIELSDLGNLLVEATHQALEQERHIAELQQQLASFQRWEETILKYEVVELYEGRYAYKLRNPTTDLETKLRYCTHCFDSRKLSLLQERGNAIGVYECPACEYQLAPPRKQETPPVKVNAPSTRRLQGRSPYLALIVPRAS
jgi:ribosomal protein L37AE/L43A